MADERTINQEAGLPDNWVPKDVKPVVPGTAAPPSVVGVRSELGDFYSGSLAPGLQHDANFVRTGYQVPSSGAQTPLMPLAPSGLPQVNSAIQSGSTSHTFPVGSGGMKFRGVWLEHVFYSINDVVLFNLSAYVAIAASTGEEPDNNTTFWTLLSENLVFNADVIGAGNTGLGTYDTSLSTNGSTFPVQSAPVAGPLTPGVSTGWAILLTSISEGVAGIPGWIDLGSSVGFIQEGIYVKTFTSNASISVTQLQIDYRWVTNLATFAGAGELLTGAVTSVLIDNANQLTVGINNQFSVGTRVAFSGMTTATFLNLQTITITSRTNTTVTGTFVHGAYPQASDTGVAKNIPFLQSKAFSATSSGAPQNVSITFDNPVLQDSTILIAALVEDVNGRVVINSATDSQGHTYHLLPGTNGGAGSAAWGAFSQRVAAGTLTVTANITTNTGTIGLKMVAIEMPGSGADSAFNYLPYDVEQFRGSMYVCNTATSDDAYADPDSWWLLAQGTGYVDSLSTNYSVTILDYGRLISNSSSSAYTVTLPTTPPSNSWWVSLQNSGTGTLTVNPNGITLNGSTSSIVMIQGQGMFIWTDGSVYFCILVNQLGSLWNTVSKTTTYSAVAGDFVLCNTSGGIFTVTLPAASSNKNHAIRIKKTSSDSNILTIGRTGSDTIDGATTQALVLQNNMFEFISDGTNWWIS